MSQGYYDRQKKQRRNYILIVVAGVFFVGFLMAAFHFAGAKKDPGYGQIEDVTVPKEDIMEETEPEDATPIKVITFNVGDALSVLVDYGQTEVLYDTGYAETGSKLVKRLKRYVDGDIEYLIVSHSHADHCGGVPAILDNFTVDNIITSGETAGESQQFDNAMEAIRNSGSNVFDDDDLTFDLGEGFTMNIIETFDPGEVDNVNDLSVIAYFERDDQRILITGDAEEDAEKSLLGTFENISLFIAGHHMSNTSNSYRLLAECSPDVIVVSCAGPGKSEYGFPQKAALRRCLAVTSDVYATYKSGDILVVFNQGSDGSGESMQINCPEDDALKLDED